MDYWLLILILSSLAPIPIQSELVRNESVVNQWLAPKHMSGQRELRSLASNQATQTKLNSAPDDMIDTPSPPYAAGAYRGGIGYSVVPNGHGYQMPNFYQGPPVPNPIPYQPIFYNNGGNYGPNQVPYGGGPGYGVPPPPGCCGGGNGDRPVESSNLVINAVLNADQCEGHKENNFTVLLVFDKKEFCIKQTIVDNSVSTITAKFNKNNIVNELQYFVTIFKQRGGHTFLELLCYVIRGRDSLEGLWVFLRIIIKDGQLFRKCGPHPDSSHINADNITLLVADLLPQQLAKCHALPSGCWEVVRSSSNTVCQDNTALIF